MTSTRNGHTLCSRSLRCHRRVESLQLADLVLEEQMPHVVADAWWSLSHKNLGAARRTSNRAAQYSVVFPRSVKWHSPARRPGPRSSRSRFLLRECPLPAPSPSCSSHHPWPEEHHSEALIIRDKLATMKTFSCVRCSWRNGCLMLTSCVQSTCCVSGCQWVGARR